MAELGLAGPPPVGTVVPLPKLSDLVSFEVEML